MIITPYRYLNSFILPFDRARDVYRERSRRDTFCLCPHGAAISLMPDREEMVTEHFVIKVTIIWLCSLLYHFLQVKASEHQQEAYRDTQSQVKFPIFFYPSLHINSVLPIAHIIMCFNHLPKLDSSTLRDDGQERGFAASHRPIVPFSAYHSENPQEMFVSWMNNKENLKDGSELHTKTHANKPKIE